MPPNPLRLGGGRAGRRVRLLTNTSAVRFGPQPPRCAVVPADFKERAASARKPFVMSRTEAVMKRSRRGGARVCFTACLQTVAERGLQLLAVAAREREPRAVLQKDVVLAMRPGLQLLDAVESDDCGAVYADELFGIELRFEAGDGLAQEVRLLARVYGDVVALGLDPVNLIRVEEEDAAPRFHNEPLAVARRLAHLFEQSQYARVHTCAAVAPDLAFGALDGRLESLAVEGLQEIVERVELEGAHSVVVVCGDEDDGRQPLVLQGFEHGEAADLRHLHVEQYEIGAHRLDGLDGLRAVRALGDDAYLGVVGGHPANLLARQRLVVHDENADGRLGGVRHRVRKIVNRKS